MFRNTFDLLSKTLFADFFFFCGSHGLNVFSSRKLRLCLHCGGAQTILNLRCTHMPITLKPVLNGHSQKEQIGFQDQLSFNAGQKYCRMLQWEHSAILLTFIKLPFVIKIFVLSIYEWPFYTGFTYVLHRFYIGFTVVHCADYLLIKSGLKALQLI